MQVKIRQARSRDAQPIASIAFEAFGEELDHERTKAQVVAGINFVASVEAQVVGFAGSFLTISQECQLRFELDLLAVAAMARGAGIGAKLVSYCLAAASDHNADLMRALVARSNRGMQRLCLSAGLRISASAQALYVLDLKSQPEMAPRPGMPAAAETAPEAADCGAHLVPVDTLSYSGIWLEGQISERTICVAIERAKSERRSRVGAVLPKADCEAINLLAASGFQRVGEYDWWTIRPGSARS